MTSTPAPVLRLEVHVCADRTSYAATFTGSNAEALAIAFCEARRATHAIEWADDQAPDYEALRATFPALYSYLDPTCDHGMSASLCAGPGHYPADNPF